MLQACSVVLLVALAGCASLPPPLPSSPSPCFASEASYECQIERYRNVNVD